MGTKTDLATSQKTRFKVTLLKVELQAAIERLALTHTLQPFSRQLPFVLSLPLGARQLVRAFAGLLDPRLCLFLEHDGQSD